MTNETNMKSEKPDKLEWEGMIVELDASSCFGFVLGYKKNQSGLESKEIYFRIEDGVDCEDESWKDGISKNDHVEFNIDDSKKTVVAVGMKRLPDKSVSFQKLLPGRFFGIVEKELELSVKPRDNSYENQSQEPSEGRILLKSRRDESSCRIDVTSQYTVTDESVKFEFKEDMPLSFSGRDVYHKNLILAEGDLVSFSIYVDFAKGGKFGATLVIFEEPSPVGRKVGCIERVVRDRSFGFLSCPGEQNAIFFHFTSMLDKEDRIDTGRHVEFIMEKEYARDGGSAARGQHRLLARRLTYLPLPRRKRDVINDSGKPLMVVKNIKVLRPKNREDRVNFRLRDDRKKRFSRTSSGSRTPTSGSRTPNKSRYNK